MTAPASPTTGPLTAAPPALPSTGTSLDPTAHTVWQRSRGPLAGLAVLLVFAALYAALASTDTYGPLDPRSPRADGSRALSHLLAARGVSVATTTTTPRTVALSRQADTTLLIASPNLLDTDQLRSLQAAGPARIVLIGPDAQTLGVLAPGVTEAPVDTSSDPATNRQPGCALPEARRAGSAEFAGASYLPAARATRACYPADIAAPDLGYGLALAPRSGGDTVVVSSADLLENSRLAQQGNASLALQILGAHSHLVWYLPAQGDGAATSPAQQRGLLDLLPAGWRWGLLQAGIAALLAALWRARRLGPVVPERLPVVVRAAETTEGRARLYHRARARDRAAEALRQATRDRLAPLVGATGDTAPAALAAAVADRLPPATGSAEELSAPDVHDLLYGPPPADDARLIRLADRLDALERQVHHP